MENQEYNKFSGDYSTSQPSQPFTQQYVQNETPLMKPKNWMTEAILVTVIPFCCLCNLFSLLGIVAIVYAGKVNTLYFAGQYGEADRASKDAKMWVLIALIAVLVTFIGYILYMSIVGWDTLIEAFREGYESVRDSGATQY
ncbi:MAG: CD225/dispanin family protein [Dysgonamonadaceae bacterium]|jgi:hypothetical protein|nr:CD225/dispanin family protein [Dysgonamonadaceae bacterium]